MNLRHLSDDELIKSSERSVARERESTTVVLHHFLEIERRRLFADYKFNSLFDMAMKHFNYTEDQANYRISAMRLLKALPELESKINSGALTLTHLNLARSHFRREKKHTNKNVTKAEMLELVTKMEKTSKKKSQVLLQSVSVIPVVLPHDEIKPITQDKILMKFAADASLESDVQTLKGLLAHKYPDLSIGELFKKLCELGLQEWSPAKEPKRKKASKLPGPVRGAESKSVMPPTEKSAENRTQIEPEAQTHAQDKIPILSASEDPTQASIHRHVWKRDNSTCTNCGSQFFLQRDHRTPRAKGGGNGPENLRLLCRPCNQRAAINEFGLPLMDRYINN